MRSNGIVTAREQDYLKSIYLLHEERDTVTSKMLCEEMKVRAPTVTSMLKKLDSDKLIRYERYGTIVLTGMGTRIALEVIRHHRLLETFFSRVLGFGMHEVHEEADELEHMISETLEERIAEMLGHPKRDPHGSPIPGKDGHVDRLDFRPLAELEAGSDAVIERIMQRSSEHLRYLEESGLVPGAHITVLEKKPLDGPIVLSTKTNSGEIISHELASKILVRPSDKRERSKR